MSSSLDSMDSSGTMSNKADDSNNTSMYSEATPPSAKPPAKGIVRRKIIRKKLHAKTPASQITSATERSKSVNSEDDFFNLTQSYDEEESKASIKRMLEENKSMEDATINDEMKKETEKEKKTTISRELSPIEPESSKPSTSVGTKELSKLINNALLGSGPIDSMPSPSDIIVLDDSDIESDVDSNVYTPSVSNEKSDFESETESETMPSHEPERKRRRRRGRGDDEDNPPSEDIIEIIDQEESSISEITHEPEEEQVVEQANISVDFDQDDTELDPVLLEKIKQRKAELEALKAQSFTVGIIIRTLMSGFEDEQPFLVTEHSTQTMGAIKKRYLESLRPRTRSQMDFINLHCILVWNNTQVYDFATPQTLGVTVKSPSMLLNAMTLMDFEKNLMEEFKQRLEPIDYDELVRQQLEDLQEANQDKEEEKGKKEEDGEFRISMKGKDNKSLHVLVNPDTKIQKLVDYYRSQHEIPRTTEITLLFDDEELDPSDLIKNTELEEDFTIDVYVC